jgi:hypothetical protein
MTPKEKALELITRFQHPLSEESQTDCLHIEVAKEFALILVNEILEMVDKSMQGFLDSDIISYWEQVKNEIQKL